MTTILKQFQKVFSLISTYTLLTACNNVSPASHNYGTEESPILVSQNVIQVGRGTTRKNVTIIQVRTNDGEINIPKEGEIIVNPSQKTEFEPHDSPLDDSFKIGDTLVSVVKIDVGDTQQNWLENVFYCGKQPAGVTFGPYNNRVENLGGNPVIGNPINLETLGRICEGLEGHKKPKRLHKLALNTHSVL